MKSTHFLCYVNSHMKSKTKIDKFIGFDDRKIFGN